MQNELPIPYYLQLHGISKTQLTNFSQISNTAESLQTTLNPYPMDGYSMSSNKPLRVFTGTDPEDSVEDCLNAVTSNLILNIGPDTVKTTLHQIGYIDAQLYSKTHLMAQPKNGFPFYL